LICVECPDLVEDLTRELAKDGVRGKGGKNGDLTVLLDGWDVEVKTLEGKSVLRKDGDEKVYKVGSIGKSVQELWVNGGLEGFIRASL
jgi:homoaconitate hydratase